MADESGIDRAATGASGAEGTTPPAYPYTVHDDVVTTDPTPDTTATGPRGVDPVGLLAGLAALAVAVLAVTGALDGIDGRWLLAGAAIVVGAAVLSATLGRRARHDR